MDIESLLKRFDKVISDTSWELADYAEIEFAKTSNQITFTLSDGLGSIRKEITRTLGGNGEPGLYYFEVRFRNFFTEAMKMYDGRISDERTEFSKKRKYFCEQVLPNLWNEIEGRTSHAHPKLIKKRLMHHYCARPKRNAFESDDWVPFYLGVSQNIHRRLFEHLEHYDENYSSMKLFHFIYADSAFRELPIRLSTAEINNASIGQRYAVIRETESILRERFHPIVGKQ